MIYRILTKSILGLKPLKTKPDQARIINRNIAIFLSLLQPIKLTRKAADYLATNPEVRRLFLSGKSFERIKSFAEEKGSLSPELSRHLFILDEKGGPYLATKSQTRFEVKAETAPERVYLKEAILRLGELVGPSLVNPDDLTPEVVSTITEKAKHLRELDAVKTKAYLQERKMLKFTGIAAAIAVVLILGGVATFPILGPLSLYVGWSLGGGLGLLAIVTSLGIAISRMRNWG